MQGNTGRRRLGNFSDDRQDEREPSPFHPAKIALFLSLASLTMIFLMLTMAYLYNRIEQGIAPIKLPLIFLGNTLVLLASSLAIHQANQSYLEDDTAKYKTSLRYTIALTLLFMALQVVGWQQLTASNHSFFSGSDNARSYLQLISAFHFVHVFAGLPFLIAFYITARKRMVEPVSVLVYFSDPIKKLRLRLLTIYWHFLDGLWVYLVLFFFVNSLV